MRKTNRKTEADLLDELKRSTDRKRGLLSTAERLGMSPQFVSDVINGRRAVTPRLAEAMGYRRVVEYERAA